MFNFKPFPPYVIVPKYDVLVPKYDPNNYLKFLAGQKKDSETNLLHLKHMVWNALAVLELYLMENEDETLFD